MSHSSSRVNVEDTEKDVLRTCLVLSCLVLLSHFYDGPEGLQFCFFYFYSYVLFFHSPVFFPHSSIFFSHFIFFNSSVFFSQFNFFSQFSFFFTVHIFFTFEFFLTQSSLFYTFPASDYGGPQGTCCKLNSCCK